MGGIADTCNGPQHTVLPRYSGLYPAPAQHASSTTSSHHI